jgi:hypothetical protein
MDLRKTTASPARVRSRWKWLVALGAVFVPAISLGTVVLPTTFTSGAVLKADDLNANFAALKASVEQLQAQKPIVLEDFTAGPVTGANGWAWLAGTAADVEVPAGAQVSVSVSLYATPIPDDTGGPSAFRGQFAVCYRTGTGVPTIAKLQSIALLADGTFGLQQVPVHVQDTLQFAAAGSYRFGVCASDDAGHGYAGYAAHLHTSAVIYPQ